MKLEEDANDAETNQEIESKRLSETGIRLTQVWLVESSFVDHGHSSLLSGETPVDAGQRVTITPSANVWLSDERAAIVQLGVRVSPTATPTFEATAVFAAHYLVVDASPVLPLEEFAWGNGLANLMPFVRTKLAQLTSESRFPTFYLQPMNLAALQADASEVAADDQE